jgi:hypothetical protein
MKIYPNACGAVSKSRPNRCPSPPLKYHDFDQKNTAPFICPSWQNAGSKRSEAKKEFKTDAGGKSLNQKAKE